MIENPNQRFQFFPCAVLPCLPFSEQGSQSCQFVLSESQLTPHRIHNNAQEGHLCGQALSLMAGYGDTQPSALIQQDLKTCLAHRGVWGSHQDVVI